jgi:hypothetical protein
MRQWGLNEAREKLDCSRFSVPRVPAPALEEAQLALF